MCPLRREILDGLAQRIQEITSGWHPQDRLPISLGIPPLEDVLPERRLPAGSLVELLCAREGAGVWTLALLMAREACGERKVLVVADRDRCFYPPEAARLGVALGRSIVVRPATRRDAYVVVDQSLRCPAVGTVISWYERLSRVEWRRLQLAAEAGGGVGFLLGPSAALGTPSCSVLRLLVAPLASADASRRIRVQVVRCRGGKCGRSLVLEIDDETGHVRVPAPLASPAAVPRPARTSG